MLSFFRKPAHFVSAVVPAAGLSSRMEGINKMLAEIDGIPIIIHTLMALERCRSIAEIVLVVPDDQIPDYLRLVGEFQLKKVAVITKGGDSRQQSVAMGVAAVSERCEYVCIHDGARPFVTADIVEDCIDGAVSCGAATAATPLRDTLKQADSEGFVRSTLPREQLYLVQTPQVFELNLYREAQALAIDDYTDDCQLIEAMGHRVMLTQGSVFNIKLTTPEDLILAEGIYDHYEG